MNDRQRSPGSNDEQRPASCRALSSSIGDLERTWNRECLIGATGYSGYNSN